jgi:hypothetical protein
MTIKKVILGLKTNFKSKLNSKKLFFFLVFNCVFAIYCVYNLSQTTTINLISTFDGLLFFFGTYSHYYLFIIPLYIFVGYDIINNNRVENYFFTRVNSRKIFSIINIFSIIFFSIISILSVLVIFSLIFLVSLKNNNFNEKLYNFSNNAG